MDIQKLTVRAAQEITGVAAADFSRIRKANLGRFTIDRPMSILSCLEQEVEMWDRCACGRLPSEPKSV